ncbi:hypothetical protein [Amycolatopsis coloradensis]|uniref:hypothetical protein n=1 Tax=Amycolatopsis coloradensis TaxID=76021 RepID=UPI001178CE43|nr:hypothetical protein [Amycolatopsis coloradensis]
MSWSNVWTVVKSVFSAGASSYVATTSPQLSNEDAKGFLNSMGNFVATKAPGGQGGNAAAVTNMVGGN